MSASASGGAAVPCTEVRRVVFEFLDEELPAPEAALIVEHLDLCSPCAGFFTFERAFLAVVRKRVPIDQAPEDLRDRIRAALADRARRGPTS
jgi:mycothiol system anti-sigma-R factor